MRNQTQKENPAISPNQFAQSPNPPHDGQAGAALQDYPTYRFPKWLYGETYTITHDASAPGRFAVTILRGKNRLVGIGATITQAAKRAYRSQAGR